MNRIRVEREGAVGRIVLARPEKKNALDEQAALELDQALHEFGDDPGVHVVLLTAQGDDFCAGADLAALEAMVDAAPEIHRRDAQALGRVFTSLRELPQPVVAAVRGRALAGGAGLASACDLVLAHEDAQFGYPEVRVGFVPAMVMTMLRRSVGEKRAFELVATGRVVSAREALELGLVSRVLTGAEFDAQVDAVVQQLARSAPNALHLTKQLFYALDRAGFHEGIALGVEANVAARATDDFREGVRRFVRRRKDQS
ncbi:MAG TPA: enoyl-CoA hydratase/isomerase family protein [Gemmatimonadaceae bacterium]